jgi:hypothetical protein
MIVGLSIGVNFLDLKMSGGQLPFGPTLFMIMVTLIGTFTTFTGIILHSISRLLLDKSNADK